MKGILNSLFTLTGVMFPLLLVWLFGKTFNVSSKVYYFALVPFFAGIFDYVENVFIIKMINSFPELQVTTVKIASIFTIIKSSSTMFFFVVLIVGFALLCKQKVSNKRG